MADALYSLAALGAWSGEALWLPLAAWTLAGLFVLSADYALPLRRPLVRQRLLVALLAALPLGIALRLAFPLFLPGQAAPALDFFVLETTVATPALGVAAEQSPAVLPALAGAAVCLLLLAAATGLMHLLVQHARLHHWLRSLPAATGAALPAHIHTRLADRLPRRARLRLVDADVSPFTYGVLRPTIVLPARLAADADALHLALAHEEAHVAHGDAIWHLAARLAIALAPWHPLAWRLLRRAELRREQAADAYVLGHFPVARQQYAHLLLDYGAVPAPAAALAASVHQLKPRITAMKQMLNLRARGLVPALAMLLSLSAALSLRAQQTPPPQQQTPPPDDAVFVVVEDMPTMLPSNEVGMQNLMASIRYPQEAKDAGIEGRVIVQFVVNEVGEVEDAAIVRGIGGGADEEALRAVRELRFTPGRQKGEAVKVQFMLPVTFRLSPEPPTLPSFKQNADGSLRDFALNPSEWRRTVGELSGQVVDAETGTPLAAVAVVLDNTSQGVATDTDGRFVLRGIPAEVTAIRIIYPNYRSLRVEIDTPPGDASAPEGYALSVVPNPSSGRAEIRFTVPAAERAQVEVYNALGQRVAVVYDEMTAAGQTYRATFDGESHAPGVYFFRLIHGGHTLTQSATIAR